MVEAIELEHFCIGASTPRVVYSTEVVAERKVEVIGWLVGNDTKMHRTKDGVHTKKDEQGVPKKV